MYIHAAVFNQLNQIHEILHPVWSTNVLDSLRTLFIMFFFMDRAAVNTVMAIWLQISLCLCEIDKCVVLSGGICSWFSLK